MFDIPLHSVVFEILQNFHKEYKKLPNEITALEAFNQEAKKQKLNSEIISEINSGIKDAFYPVDIEEQFAKNTLVDFAKKQMVKKLFEENADGIETADDSFFKKLFNKISEINRMGEENKQSYEGSFLLKDYGQTFEKPIEGNPTYLKKLNSLTSAHGFHTPQLITITGGPKSFKTGVTLSIVVNYVRDGYKVFFADAENGKSSILNRAYQAMLGCTREELLSGELKDILAEMVRGYKALGGDMRAHYFPSYVSTLDDVDLELERLKEEDNWVPDIIVYDYLDLFGAADKSIKDKRLVIQASYHHAVRLNNKWGTFCFSPSQINKESVNKEYMDITAFAEDFGKAANAHAAFGIVGLEEDRLKGFASLVPIMQREGKRFSYHNQCPILIDESRMIVEEDPDFWDRNIEKKLGGLPTEKPKHTFKSRS